MREAVEKQHEKWAASSHSRYREAPDIIERELGASEMARDYDEGKIALAVLSDLEEQLEASQDRARQFEEWLRFYADNDVDVDYMIRNRFGVSSPASEGVSVTTPSAEVLRPSEGSFPASRQDS